MVERSHLGGLPRWSEILLAGLGLIVVAPVLGVAALAILLETGRPIVFSQTRMGWNGKPFIMRKLRSMYVNGQSVLVTTAKDPRITPVGRWLRRTKIDEMLTLWNVLAGDMSLVGPRPEAPRFVDLRDHRWQRILSAKPGLTDPVTFALRDEEILLASISGDVSAYYLQTLQPKKMDGQIRYLESRTWRSDLAVLTQTVAAIVFPKYGSGSEISAIAQGSASPGAPETGGNS